MMNSRVAESRTKPIGESSNAVVLGVIDDRHLEIQDHRRLQPCVMPLPMDVADVSGTLKERRACRPNLSQSIVTGP
jgi:hypothetical protein